MLRKLTADEAMILKMEHFADYYEFGDDGKCVSLRDGNAIGSVNGTVAVSGARFASNVLIKKIVAVMYMGVTDTAGKRISNIDGDVLNNAVCNIRVEEMSEYKARRAIERGPYQKPKQKYMSAAGYVENKRRLTKAVWKNAYNMHIIEREEE